jgi:hypothetical protein
MAYDLIGISPLNSYGKAFRLNTWIWHDYLIIMHHISAIDRAEARQMMFSDGFSLSAQDCARISDTLRERVNVLSIEESFNKYKDFRQYSLDEKFAIGPAGYQSIIFSSFLYFLENCGGFEVR